MASLFGRKVVDYKTNKTGGGVIKGDVLIPDTTNDNAFTTTTSANYTGGVWIADETIPNNGTGRVVLQGHVTLVLVNASVTRGHYGATYTVAKQATDAGTSRTSGTFCRFTTGGTTPEADIWPVDLGGSALTDPTTTEGDMIYRAAGILARLAVGASDTVLKGGTDPSYGYPPVHGCAMGATASRALSTSGEALILLDQEDHDTDAYHFTSDAALTGTVAKTAASAAIVGSGTSFTTELSVGQVITIPGTAVEVGIVSVITDNTHITLQVAMANSASGQTATRRSGYVVVPAGKGGKYVVTLNGRGSANVESYLIVRKNSATVGGGTIVLFAGMKQFSALFTGGVVSGAASITLAAWDTIELMGIANSASNLIYAGAGGPTNFLSADMVGV